MRLTSLFVAAGVIGAAASLPEEGKRWWKHVEFLASDRLEGRVAGSEGHRTAAEYVAKEFARSGLKPPRDSDYIQQVPFVRRALVPEKSRLTLVTPEGRKEVQVGEHALVSLRVDPTETTKAPLVFVGYGISAAEEGHDDLKDLDVRGKIVVYMTGAPARFSGPVAAHYQSGPERLAGLSRAGAAGAISITSSMTPETPWDRAAKASLLPSLGLPDTPGERRLALSFNPAHAQVLFEGTDQNASDLAARASRGEPLPRFALKASLEAQISVRRDSVRSENVVGVLPGTDPKRRGELVVMTAHLDHLGLGAEVNGDGIYNGAMDNASGVSSLIEIAAAMRDRRAGRTIVFAAVTGEEKGLLGSQYFAVKTPVPGTIVANVNLDMFLPLFPFRSIMALGLDESDMGDHLRRVAETLGIEVQSDPEPRRNRFTRSDQYSFIRRGVPALAFKFGYQKGSAEEKIAQQWTAARYHQPGDDLQQPVDIGAAGAFNHLMSLLLESVAKADARPRWKESSFFRRFAN